MTKINIFINDATVSPRNFTSTANVLDKHLPQPSMKVQQLLIICVTTDYRTCVTTTITNRISLKE